MTATSWLYWRIVVSVVLQGSVCQSTSGGCQCLYERVRAVLTGLLVFLALVCWGQLFLLLISALEHSQRWGCSAEMGCPTAGSVDPCYCTLWRWRHFSCWGSFGWVSGRTLSVPSSLRTVWMKESWGCRVCTSWATSYGQLSPDLADKGFADTSGNFPYTECQSGSIAEFQLLSGCLSPSSSLLGCRMIVSI